MMISNWSERMIIDTGTKTRLSEAAVVCTALLNRVATLHSYLNKKPFKIIAHDTIKFISLTWALSEGMIYHSKVSFFL